MQHPFDLGCLLDQTDHLNLLNVRQSLCNHYLRLKLKQRATSLSQRLAKLSA